MFISLLQIADVTIFRFIRRHTNVRFSSSAYHWAIA
jgi:hypothetical protein